MPLCCKWLLLQTVSWRSFTATTPVLAEHFAVLAEDTDCMSCTAACRPLPTSELWQSEEQICARWPGSWRWSALGVLLSDDLTLKSTVFFVMSPCALVTCQLSNSRLLNVDLLFHFLFSNGESWWQAIVDYFQKNTLSADILSMNTLLTGN